MEVYNFSATNGKINQTSKHLIMGMVKKIAKTLSIYQTDMGTVVLIVLELLMETTFSSTTALTLAPKIFYKITNYTQA